MATTNTLTWTANTEANLQDYRVWRAIDGAAEGLLAVVPKGTQTYVDTVTVDGVYSYSLTARNTAGLESWHSLSVSKTVTTVNPPQAPVGLAVV